MKGLIKYIKKRQFLMLFTWIILLIGLIVGIIIAFQSKNTFIPVLKEYQQQINGLTFINLFTHFCL